LAVPGTRELPLKGLLSAYPYFTQGHNLAVQKLLFVVYLFSKEQISFLVLYKIEKSRTDDSVHNMQ
jgi:hypothetical protein